MDFGVGQLDRSKWTVLKRYELLFPDITKKVVGNKELKSTSLNELRILEKKLKFSVATQYSSQFAKTSFVALIESVEKIGCSVGIKLQSFAIDFLF